MKASKRRSQRLAIFDIDGTVFRSAVEMEIVDRMIQRGMLPQRDYEEVVNAKDAWKNRQGTFEQYTDRFVHFMEHEFAGVSEREYTKLARQVIDEMKDHQYRYTRVLIGKLRRRGYVLIAISGMLLYALKIYNEYLGFDYIYGSEFAISDGKFTGQAIGLQPYYNKARVVKYFLSEHAEFTMSGSVGVGDTEGDVGFLELVERPIAFNPNKKLYTMAKRRGWEIVVERKDMIYELPQLTYSVDK